MPRHRERVEALFEAALGLPPGEREAFIAGATTDEQLRRAALALLRAHDATGPLDRPPARHEAPPAAAIDPRLGPYRLMGEIGRGGMSIVYLGERDDGQFRRRVAIKVIRHDDPELHARVLAERQILASLDHPSIARLLDGGVTGDGRPYLVMEHVEGLPIDVYCDRMRLDLRERLRLFAVVARAVDHAHRNLIIHRDLKPSNILVTPAGEAKLLDFGIAKILNAGLGPVHSPFTQLHHRALTPEYASPEQLRGEALTTASDVYSLGILLHELLTGRRPHVGDGPAAAALLRAEPGRPSTFIGRARERDGRDAWDAIAAARHTTPERLRRQLRGDLDAIVLKALRAEPSRRYGSAELLARELEAHLDGRPVTASQGSRTYALRKLVRRHRLVAGSAALVALSLLGAMAIVSREAAVARAERDRAEAALHQSRELAEFLESLFVSSAPGETAGAELTVRDLVRRGVRRTDRVESPAARASLLVVLGNAYERLGDYGEAERVLERAVSLRAGGGAADYAEALERLASVKRRQADYDSAQALLARALDARVAESGRVHPDIARTLQQISAYLIYMGEIERAEALAREALELRRAGLGELHALTLDSRSYLVAVLRRRGRPAEAEALLRETLRLREQAGSQDREAVAADMLRLAELVAGRDDAESEALYRRVLAMNDAGVGPEVQYNWALGGLASLLLRRGEHQAADSIWARILDHTRRVTGEEHPHFGSTLAGYGNFLRATGRPHLARESYHRGLGIVARHMGDQHPMYAGLLPGYARVHAELGELDEADSLLVRAQRIRAARQGARSPLVAEAMADRADIAIRRGDLDTAAALLDEAHAMALESVTEEGTVVRHIEEVRARLEQALRGAG
jgi:eukaryotic-like serine/threonine-protein kinase